MHTDMRDSVLDLGFFESAFVFSLEPVYLS